MMRPTFGDTRPTFGNPPPSPAVRDEPYRPTVGVQLGMDGTELPALDAPEHYDPRPIWDDVPVCDDCGEVRI